MLQHHNETGNQCSFDAVKASDPGSCPGDTSSDAWGLTMNVSGSSAGPYEHGAACCLSSPCADGSCDDDDDYEIVYEAPGTRWARPGFGESGSGAARLTTAGSVAACAEICKEEDDFDCEGFMYKEGDSGDETGYFDDGSCTLLAELIPMETGLTGLVSGRMIDDDDDDDDDMPDECTEYTYEDHDYWFCTSPREYLPARGFCRDYGMDVVALGSDAENTWVADTAWSVDDGAWWIGFTDRHDEGDWQWETGESVTYTNWSDDTCDYPSPDDAPPGEDCAQFRTEDTCLGYMWNDLPCEGVSLSVVCEED